MRNLLDGEAETGGMMMFKDRSRDPKRGLAADDAVDDRAFARRLDGEGILQSEPRHAALDQRRDLGYLKDKVGRIAVGEVPSVGLQPMMHMIDETARPVECDPPFPAH